MKKLFIIMSLILVSSAFCWQEIIQQEDFTPAQNGTLPSTMDAEWDAGIDVIVMPYSDISAPFPAPVDHPDGDGYALRLGDINAGGGGYNFCFPANYATAFETNNAVEAWIYCNFDPTAVTVEQDYGLYVRATADPGGGAYPARSGYWFLITTNSSWGTYYPTNFRPFLMDRPSGAWVPLVEGTGTYTTGWHKLRLEAVDSTIKGYVDGNLEVSTTVSDFTAGFAGMVYYTSLVSGSDYPYAGTYDNFKWIRNPTEPFLLELAPSGTVNLGKGQTRTFIASGGTDNFIWSLSNSTVGHLSSTTGASVTFTADSAGTVDLTVSDNGPPLQQQVANITVVPTSAPLFIDADKVSLYRKELFE
jgi:hypothetical protein